MKITSVRAVAVRVPVKRPTRISTRVLDKRDYVLVWVKREDTEEEGIGYIYAGTSGGAVVAEAVNGMLAPTLLGRPADDIVGAWDAMYQETLLHGRRGAVMRAISAVDIALWDLSAKRAGLPLAVLLGGSAASVPAYASGGYYQPEEGNWADAVTREIAGNIESGFTDHKIKVGGLAVTEDAARVQAAVKTMEGRGRLAIDANNAYRTVAEAERALRAFEEAAGDTGLWWYEEPLSPDDVHGHARLRDRSRTPIATGEIAASRWEFRDLIERGAADILQSDAGVMGGVTEFLRVAAAAATFALPIAPHWHANLHAHLSAAITNCMTVEHFALEKDIYNFELLVTPDTRLAVAEGHVLVPERPGLGFDLQNDAVRRFAM
ncbi:mandelate racemase/muconate lactonizing enzyme family protein [Streptomyces sp. NBC_01314]|uniref:mandelate racemase/muconate lactonizing enzyme family protein n=1 Tax=Streptomyces sp. NBC_01314 TaxID=2903821 RepID=UPI003093C96F|nr:mandelate racemase/muconate lactonizing enzyme family protein [Streptomyces sp. NBC_01314]